MEAPSAHKTLVNKSLTDYLRNTTILLNYFAGRDPMDAQFLSDLTEVQWGRAYNTLHTVRWMNLLAPALKEEREPGTGRSLMRVTAPSDQMEAFLREVDENRQQAAAHFLLLINIIRHRVANAPISTDQLPKGEGWEWLHEGIEELRLHDLAVVEDGLVALTSAGIALGGDVQTGIHSEINDKF